MTIHPVNNVPKDHVIIDISPDVQSIGSVASAWSKPGTPDVFESVPPYRLHLSMQKRLGLQQKMGMITAWRKFMDRSSHEKNI